MTDTQARNGSARAAAGGAGAARPPLALPDAFTARPSTVAHRIAEWLVHQGIDRVYGLPGGHVKPIWDELTHAGVRIVVTRHEVAAVHMAQADADLTGEVAVAIVTAGPGLTNAVTGLGCAYLARSPVLVISARVPRPQVGMGALEEVNQVDTVRAVTRAAEVVLEPRRLMPQLDAALMAALGEDGPQGPAYVELASDILKERAPSSYEGATALARRRRSVLPPDPDTVAQAAELLRESRRPLVISGRGAVGHTDALVRFLAATGALYVDTRASKAALPEGVPGYVPAVRAWAMAEADAVVTVGRALDFELAYGSPAVFRSAKRFVRIGRSADELRENRRGDAEVRGDVSLALDALVEADAVPRRPDARWRDGLQEENDLKVRTFREQLRERPPGDDGAMHPYRLLAEVNDFVDDSTIVVVDGGDILSFSRAALRTPTYLDLGPFGCLGVGVPFAISAALRYPERRVIAVVGDGAFGFNAMELETAVREGARIVVVVANNSAWNIERWDAMNHFDGRVLGTELSDASYDLVARGLGAHGERVRDPDDLPAALERAFANAPALVDVVVTRDAESADTRSELAQVPDLMALEMWNVAEHRWLATDALPPRSGGLSMPVRIHQPSERPPPRGFSEATSGNGVVAISGQLAAEELLERKAPFHEQFISALRRFLEVAGSAGAAAEDVLIMRIYVTSVETYKAELKQFGSEYRDAYGGQYPATTLLEVSGLIDDRAMVEIEGMAALP
jgi:acetolactate synthase I/II/III large subunit